MMVRIGYVEGCDVKKLAIRCDKKHKYLLKRWGSYSFDDICMLYARGDKDADVYMALAMGMMNERICVRSK